MQKLLFSGGKLEIEFPRYAPGTAHLRLEAEGGLFFCRMPAEELERFRQRHDQLAQQVPTEPFGAWIAGRLEWREATAAAGH